MHDDPILFLTVEDFLFHTTFPVMLSSYRRPYFLEILNHY